jgi:hypothetical protein
MAVELGRQWKMLHQLLMVGRFRPVIACGWRRRLPPDRVGDNMISELTIYCMMMY